MLVLLDTEFQKCNCRKLYFFDKIFHNKFARSSTTMFMQLKVTIIYMRIVASLYLEKICKLWVPERNMAFLFSQSKYDISKAGQALINGLVTAKTNHFSKLWIRQLNSIYKQLQQPKQISKNTWVSFNWSPVEPLLESRSLPARSIRFKTPCFSVVCKNKTAHVTKAKPCSWRGHREKYKKSTSLTADMRNVKTKWLLDDCSFICVFPTDLNIEKLSQLAR